MATVIEIRISVFSLIAAVIYLSWYYMSFGEKIFSSSNYFSFAGIGAVTIIFASLTHLFILNSLPLLVIPQTLMFTKIEGFQNQEENEDKPVPVTYTQEMCENIKGILNQYVKAKEEYGTRNVKGLKEALNTAAEQLKLGGCERFGLGA